MKVILEIPDKLMEEIRSVVRELVDRGFLDLPQEQQDSWSVHQMLLECINFGLQWRRQKDTLIRQAIRMAEREASKFGVEGS